MNKLEELENYVKDLKGYQEKKRLELDVSHKSTKVHKAGQICAYNEVLKFIEILKNNSNNDNQ